MGEHRAGLSLQLADETRHDLAEYEAGLRQWTEHGTMPWRHFETVSRVIGSIAGGLQAAFAEITPAPGEQAALQAGLDPDMEADGQLGPAP